MKLSCGEKIQSLKREAVSGTASCIFNPRALFVAGVLLGAMGAGHVMPTFAQAESMRAELPAVTKSRELLLKNDRAGALQLLTQALGGTPSTVLKSGQNKSSGVKVATAPKAATLTRAQRQELLTALRETREIFLTERGQAQYSLAASLWLQKPREALQALESAQASEKGNSLVTQLMARAWLRVQDCARAKRELQTLASAQAGEAAGLSAEVQLLQLQQQLCGWEQESTTKIFKAPQSPELLPYEIFIKRLVFKDAIRRRDLKSAQATIAAWEAIDPQDPELWWAKWRASRSTDAAAGRVGQEGSMEAENPLGDFNAGRKYISMCTDLSPRRRAKYELDPELCERVDKVESELKNMEQKP